MEAGVVEKTGADICKPKPRFVPRGAFDCIAFSEMLVAALNVALAYPRVTAKWRKL